MPAFDETNKIIPGIQDVIGFRSSGGAQMAINSSITASALVVCNHPYSGQNIKGIITFRIGPNNIAEGTWQVSNLPQGTLIGTITAGADSTISIPINSIMTGLRIDLTITVTAGAVTLLYPRFIVQEKE